MSVIWLKSNIPRSILSPSMALKIQDVLVNYSLMCPHLGYDSCWPFKATAFVVPTNVNHQCDVRQDLSG